MPCEQERIHHALLTWQHPEATLERNVVALLQVSGHCVPCLQMRIWCTHLQRPMKCCYLHPLAFLQTGRLANLGASPVCT